MNNKQHIINRTDNQLIFGGEWKMANRTGNISKLKVGEVGQKRTKNGRIITMRRIATTGFRQFEILSNVPA